MTARKGFTLIELLIVIAVLGVIAAGVVAAINPAKRIKQANDSKIKNDVGQIATALQAYYTTNQTYPTGGGVITALAPSGGAGDLKVWPVAPTGSSYTVTDTPSGCAGTVASPCTEVAVSAVLLDPKPSLGTWCWKSSTGTASEVLLANCTP